MTRDLKGGCRPNLGPGVWTAPGVHFEAARPGVDLAALIDVMMALLIVFILITPVVTDTGVDLPVAIHGVEGGPSGGVTLEIDSQGVFYLNHEVVEAAELASRLTEEYAGRLSARVLYLRADSDASYGLVRDALSAAQAAGVRTIGAAVRIPDDTERAGGSSAPVPAWSTDNVH